jgi:hypothetical protein
MGLKHHNPEKRSWKCRSYKKGGENIRKLRETSMIKFEFTVSDEEAFDIFGALQEEIVKDLEAISEIICQYRPPHGRLLKVARDQIQWYRDRIEYLEQLKSKMSNTRV